MFDPVDAAGLAAFRIAFGSIVALQAIVYVASGYAHEHFVEPAYLFPYYGFEWVRHGPWVPWIYVAQAVAGAGVALGFRYRAAALLFTVFFVWAFLLDQAHYLNHFYLIALLGFLMAIVPAHREWSLDARRLGLVPVARRWHYGLLKGQLAVVYVFAGIAKLEPDWLRGEPIRTWLAARSHYPVIGPLFLHEWTAWLFAYGGLLLDLFVVPLLLWRRTRAFAVVALVFFHLTNALLFAIGAFPWTMLAATTLFFDPSWPRRRKGPLTSPGPARAPRVVTGFLVAWFAVQILVPLRHRLYPGPVVWTDEGHTFSWRMKLRHKSGWCYFLVYDGADGRRWRVNPKEELTAWQYAKMVGRPDLIHSYARHLAERFAREEGAKRPQVYARTGISLHGRRAQPIVAPDVDLAAQPRTPAAKSWIVPLAEPDLPVRPRGGGGGA